MRIAEIMTRSVHRVAPTAPAAEAWEVMRRMDIRHLVVMDGGEVKGILSSRDAGGAKGGRLRAASTVSDLMSRSVVTVDPEATVRKVANVMRGRSIGSVPVLDRGRLVGIVTVSDLLDLLGRGVDRPSQADRRGLHHRVAHRKTKARPGTW